MTFKTYPFNTAIFSYLYLHGFKNSFLALMYFIKAHFTYLEQICRVFLLSQIGYTATFSYLRQDTPRFSLILDRIYRIFLLPLIEYTALFSYLRQDMPHFSLTFDRIYRAFLLSKIRYTAYFSYLNLFFYCIFFLT